MMNFKQRSFTVLSVLIICALGIGGCVPPQPSETPTPTEIIDHCSEEHIDDQLLPLQLFMREFDDTSFVAQRTPRDQLATVILALQETRRKAVDLQVPDCLNAFHELQIIYMDSVITTFSNFLGGVDVEQVQAQTAQAREIRSVYEIELAALLGVTPVPTATFLPPPSPTNTLLPSATPIPTDTTIPSDTATTEPIFAEAITRANLRIGAGMDFNVIGVLEPGQTVVVLDRTEDGEWIRVEYEEAEEGIAWVNYELVELSVPIEELSIFTP